MRVPTVWGATPQELTAVYPCDAVGPTAAESWFRAVPVRAPRPVVFRWLCQLRVAPYSYDTLDNFGRRSPRTLTPGVDRLATGQRFMTIFTLVDFSPDEHLTLRMTSRGGRAVFGPFVITYAVHDAGVGASRLVAKLNVGERGSGRLSAARRRALAWGDLVMMRRQLQTLRALAEA